MENEQGETEILVKEGQADPSSPSVFQNDNVSRAQQQEFAKRSFKLI